MRRRVDSADHLVLGIRHEYVTLGADRDAFRPVEHRLFGRAVAIALFARAGDVCQSTGLQVHLPDAVPFAQGDPQCRAVDEQRSGAQHRFAGGHRSVFGENSFAVAGDRLDRTRGQVNSPYAMVADVGHVQAAATVEGDAVRLAKPGPNGRSAVAAEPGCARTGHGVDRAGFGIDLSNDGADHFDEVHVALTIETHLVRLVETRPRGGSAVTAVALLPVSRHGRDRAIVEVQTENAMVPHLADVQRSARSDLHAERLVDVHRRRGAGKQAQLAVPGTGHRGDRLAGRDCHAAHYQDRAYS